MTELGLEDISYTHGDLRVTLDTEKLNNKFHLSIGVKHRNHPVYGFDAMVLDTLVWWTMVGILKTAFGIDDNMWFDPT